MTSVPGIIGVKEYYGVNPSSPTPIAKSSPRV